MIRTVAVRKAPVLGMVRGCVAVHAVAIFAQPVLAGRYPIGDVVIWRFVADLHHPIHLHLVHFHVLARGDREPGPYDAGRKDTVDLRPAEAVEVIATFD